MFHSSSQSIWNTASFILIFSGEAVVKYSFLLKWSHLGFYNMSSWFLSVSQHIGISLSSSSSLWLQMLLPSMAYFQDHSPSVNSSYAVLPKSKASGTTCKIAWWLSYQDLSLVLQTHTQALPPGCFTDNSYSVYPKAKILFLPRFAPLPEFPVSAYFTVCCLFNHLS